MTTKTKAFSAEEIFLAGKDQMESAMKTSAQATKKNLEQAVENTKKQVEDVMKNYGDLADLSRENLEAYVAATSATAKGIEAINAEIFDYSKKVYDANMAVYKSLSGVKTPKEFFDIQTDLLKSRYEDTLAEVNKLNELATASANEAVAPISARVSEAADKFMKSVA